MYLRLIARSVQALTYHQYTAYQWWNYNQYKACDGSTGKVKEKVMFVGGGWVGFEGQKIMYCTLKN